MNVPKGHTRLMGIILAGRSEEYRNIGSTIFSLNIGVGQFLIICEFIIYVWIFCYLYKKSKSNTAVSKEMFQKGKRRNQITLFGQSLTFIVRLLLTIALQILFVLIPGDTTVFAFVQIFSSAAVTVSFLVSSPEMRRKYHPKFLENIFTLSICKISLRNRNQIGDQNKQE